MHKAFRCLWQAVDGIEHIQGETSQPEVDFCLRSDELPAVEPVAFE